MLLQSRIAAVLFVLIGGLALPSDLAEFTGLRAYGKLDPDLAGKAFLLNFTQLWANYGGGVDFQLRSQGILLCRETMPYLYSQQAIPALRYAPGSRPELEKVVAGLCRDIEDGQEKALAIMRFCRDLHQKKEYPVQWEKYLFGGREEELLEKGEILCEALARLQVALCEIAGLPGRIVMHVAGGHVCCEIHTGKGWGYLDPRMGIYFLDPAGKLLSVQDLLANPSWIDSQPDRVKKDVVAYSNWEERSRRCRNIFFSSREINLFEYYSLGDAGKYDYRQLTRQQANQLGLKEISREYHQCIQTLIQQKQGATPR